MVGVEFTFDRSKLVNMLFGTGFVGCLLMAIFRGEHEKSIHN